MPVEKNPLKDLSEILNEYLNHPEHGSFVLKDGQPLIPYRKLTALELKNNRFLVVKRIATIPDSGRSGLGKSILRFAESLARALKMDGVVLETVKETRWLYDWYKNESYQTIGIYQYPGRPLETLLMYKKAQVS